LSSLNSLASLPELRKRILFTLFILAVYRIGVHVPTPGIDGEALSNFFSSTKGTIFAMFNLFSGGALERFSIFALGIMPYITASIIAQLLTIVLPALERLSREGEPGRRKINQYTRYGTVVLSLIQGYSISVGLENMQSPSGAPIVLFPGLTFRLVTMLTLASGTAFIMWLGEQISEKGIGNGSSMIIFAGIAARIPSGFGQVYEMFGSNQISFFMVLLLGLIMVVTIAVIIFFEMAQRRIPVQYAKRVVGRKVYGGQNTHLPLKINTSGVIPPIFASSVIMFPSTIATFINNPALDSVKNALMPGGIVYNIIFVGMIVFFAYFYTAITFNTSDIADNMKKSGGYIPGIRPGKSTADYIDSVLTKLTFGGAVYLSVICVMPSIIVDSFKVNVYFGGTSLLILIGVAIDTIAQIQSHLIARNYDGFAKRVQIRGRR